MTEATSRSTRAGLVSLPVLARAALNPICRKTGIPLPLLHEEVDESAYPKPLFPAAV
jgi:hypothetical protein